MTEPAKGLALRLNMARHYVGGLPMFVEATLANETATSTYYGLTHCNPWWPPFPIEFEFRAGAHTVRLPGQWDVGEEEPTGGFTLRAGEARTFVLDLSEVDVPIPPGAWQCTARWLMRFEQPRSSPVSVKIEAMTPADAPLVQRVRRSGGPRPRSWANFVEDPRALDRADFRGLSAEARRALVPYLIIHEAAHGPAPLSKFPPEHLSHQHGPWASEAAVLGYELAWARHAPDLTGLRSVILASWPGVAFRLDEIDRGAGLLTDFRESFGRESDSDGEP
jgi:hypothetical protein